MVQLIRLCVGPSQARPGQVFMSGVKLVSGSRPPPSVAATLYLFPLKHGQNIEGAVWYKLVLFYFKAGLVFCFFLLQYRCLQLKCMLKATRIATVEIEVDIV